MKDLHSLNHNHYTWEQLLLALDCPIHLSNELVHKISIGRDFLENKLKQSSEPLYGINTGFGALCNTGIGIDSLEALQKNLILSHACGLGSPLHSDIVKRMLWLKIRSLSMGHSGVRLEVIERLILMHNHNCFPVIPSIGSLGASGDLAPLAHLSLPLIGEGEVYFNDKIITAKQWLEMVGLEPLILKEKEGLALLNGTQFMSAVLLTAHIQMERLFNWAILISALSVEAYLGTIHAFSPLISKVRQHPGQMWVADKLFSLLQNSEMQSLPREWVQDPYSFRCIPQVLGPSMETFLFSRNALLREINSVTDNPLIFPDEDQILSGGNFHGQILALTADYASIAVSEIGSISERRIYRLIEGKRNLPPFLSSLPGLNSGYMIVQYTAASLANRNKQRSMPHSVDTIESSMGQEDHVSMGANAAMKLLDMIADTEMILSLELLTAAQAFEFRNEQSPSEPLKNLLSAFNKRVPPMLNDEYQHPRMKIANRFLKTNNPFIWLNDSVFSS
jgi:histidine ammonia-lyase